jgi:hypothetical protein
MMRRPFFRLAEDNLTVIQKLNLPENTKGKSIFNPQSSVMYSISDSACCPVGFLNPCRGHHFGPSLFFRGNSAIAAPFREPSK